MNKLQRFKKFLRTLDKVAGLVISGVVSILGLVATVFFLVVPASPHLPIDPAEAVLGLGFCAMGTFTFAAVLLNTKSASWLVFANIAAWFTLYAITFDVTRGISPDLHGLIAYAVKLVSLVGFIVMARRSYLRERDEKNDCRLRSRAMLEPQLLIESHA